MEMTTYFAFMEKAGDRVETLIVLIGVILGLSIGKFITGIGNLLTERRRVHFSLSYTLFLLALFIYQIYYWWTIWDLQEVESIGFVAYVRLLLIPLFLYCGTAILVPELRRGEGFDMKAHFDEHSRVFFTVLAALIVAGISQGYFFWEHRGLQIYLRVAALVLVFPFMFFRCGRLNLVIAILLLVIAVVFVYVILQDIRSMDEVPIPKTVPGVLF